MEVLKIAQEEFQCKQSEFESPLPSEAIPGSSAAVGNLPLEQIPIPSAAVVDLPSEQIPSQSAMEDVPQQSQAPSGTVAGVISEDQRAVQSIKPEIYKPEASKAENVLDMISQGRLPNIVSEEEVEDDHPTLEFENKFDE